MVARKVFMAKKVYAVKVGRQTGLFTSWPECEAQVRGFMGAKYKGFATAAEAMAWLQGAENESAPGGAGNRASGGGVTEKISGEADYLIYTDGSCLINPNGPGGWAAVVIEQKKGGGRELSGGDPSTTNNRMELTAAVQALSAVPVGATVILCTDSQYMKNGFTKNWLKGWKKNGWKTSKGTPVLNQDLWRELDELYWQRHVEFRWVKGHVGIKYNERCDKLAKAEADKFISR